MKRDVPTTLRDVPRSELEQLADRALKVLHGHGVRAIVIVDPPDGSGGYVCGMHGYESQLDAMLVLASQVAGLASLYPSHADAALHDALQSMIKRRRELVPQ